MQGVSSSLLSFCIQERSPRRRFDTASSQNQQHSSDEDSETSSLSSEKSGTALNSNKGPVTQVGCSLSLAEESNAAISSHTLGNISFGKFKYLTASCTPKTVRKILKISAKCLEIFQKFQRCLESPTTNIRYRFWKKSCGNCLKV